MLSKVKAGAKATVEWIKTNAAWLVLILFGATTGAALIRRSSNQVNSIKQALEIERARSEVIALETRRENLVRADAIKANEALRLNAEIVELRKKIAAAHSGKRWEELTDVEVTTALRDAGLM